MTYRADILLASPSGEPIVAVEVKNREGLSREVATRLRRNMLAHGLLLDLPYFLLVSQDAGFLWKGQDEEGLAGAPTQQFSMRGVLLRYLPGLQIQERLPGSQLQLVVLKWLVDLTELRVEPSEEPEKSLALSGFLESVKGARVTAEAVL